MTTAAAILLLLVLSFVAIARLLRAPVGFVVRQGMFEVVCIPLALVGAPIVCLFARWSNTPTTFTGGAQDNGPLTVRGELPRWAEWWGTFDERLPGGMYEPTVVKWYNKYGRYWCSVRWLWRNRMFGLAKALFGHPLPADGKPKWWVSKRIGALYFGAGWKKYRATYDAHWIDGPFVEVPSVTIRVLSSSEG